MKPVTSISSLIPLFSSVIESIRSGKSRMASRIALQMSMLSLYPFKFRDLSDIFCKIFKGSKLLFWQLLKKDKRGSGCCSMTFGV